MDIVSNLQSLTPAKLCVLLCPGLTGGFTIGTGLSWCSAREMRARWLNRRDAEGCSRVVEIEATSLLEATGFSGWEKVCRGGAYDAQGDELCTGSSEKMSVCGGGVNVVSGEEREG